MTRTSFWYIDSFGTYLAIREAGLEDIGAAVSRLSPDRPPAGREFDMIADGLELYRLELADEAPGTEPDLDITRSWQLRELDTVSHGAVETALRTFERRRTSSGCAD